MEGNDAGTKHNLLFLLHEPCRGERRRDIAEHMGALVLAAVAGGMWGWGDMDDKLRGQAAKDMGQKGADHTAAWQWPTLALVEWSAAANVTATTAKVKAVIVEK